MPRKTMVYGILKAGHGTTALGYGTTNADAGVGIGLRGGIQKFDKQTIN